MSNNPGFADMARRKRRPFVWELRKEHKIVYDDGWREIMREVSREMKVPYDDVERINTAWWKYVSEMMARVELPVIRMVFLCKLHPNVKELYKYCEIMGERIDRLIHGGKLANARKKIGDVGKMSQHLSRLHDSYFRILAEKAKKKEKGAGGMTEKRRVEFERFLASDRRRQITVTMLEARKLKEQINKQNDTTD